MSSDNGPDTFSSAITVTNNNMSRLSKAVSSTATTLVSSTYGDLSRTHYQTAMAEIVSRRRPGFQKRLFTFASKRSPSEVVRSTFSKGNIQFQAVTNIPDELLRDIPFSDNQFSLYQGFEASAETSSGTNTAAGLLTYSNNDNPVPLDILNKDRNAISHRLDLLEIRKDLAANEIKEIDQRIEHMNTMRKIVFDRIAELEQEEFQLENMLHQISTEVDSIEFEGESMPKTSDESLVNGINLLSVEEDGLLSQSIYEKLQTSTPNGKSKTKSNFRQRASGLRRKTMPTLHQFYNPGNAIRCIQAHSDSITALDFDIPFGTMVSAALDDTCSVWDLSRGEMLQQLRGHNASVKCLQMEDNIVLTGSADATVKLWDLSEPENECLVESFDSHLGEVTALHFSDRTLVSGSSDKTIRQWDLQTGKCLQTLDVLWASAQSASHNFSDDLKWKRQSTVVGRGGDFVGALQCYDAALASGTADGVVRLWDLRSGQVHRTLVGHTGAVTCLQFDETHLATGSLDRSIRIWDLRTGTIFDAFAYDHAVTSLHFDSRRVVSANTENTVKIYDREIEKHWSCGAGETDPDASIVNIVRYREGYLIEGRKDGKIGVWAC